MRVSYHGPEVTRKCSLRSHLLEYIIETVSIRVGEYYKTADKHR